MIRRLDPVRIQAVDSITVAAANGWRERDRRELDGERTVGRLDTKRSLAIDSSFHRAAGCDLAPSREHDRCGRARSGDGIRVELREPFDAAEQHLTIGPAHCRTPVQLSTSDAIARTITMRGSGLGGEAHEPVCRA